MCNWRMNFFRLNGKHPDAGKDWMQEKSMTEDETDGIFDSVHMSLSTLQEIVKGQKAWSAAVHGVTKSRTGLSDWTIATNIKEVFDDSSRNVFAIPGLKKRKLRIQQKREMIVDGERWQSSQEGIKSMPRWRFCFGFGDTASTNKDGGRRRCLFSFMASLQISSSNSTEQVKSYKKNCLLFIDAYARYVYLTHVL